MIQMQSCMTVADNSGAKIAQCIKVIGGSHRRYAGIGDIVVVAIKDAIPTSAIKKGAVKKADIIVHKQTVIVTIPCEPSFTNNELEIAGQQEPIKESGSPRDINAKYMTASNIKII